MKRHYQKIANQHWRRVNFARRFLLPDLRAIFAGNREDLPPPDVYIALRDGIDNSIFHDRPCLNGPDELSLPDLLTRFCI